MTKDLYCLLEPDSNFSDIINIFCHHVNPSPSIGIVIGPKSRLLGVISQSDIIKGFASKNLQELRAQDIMNGRPIVTELNKTDVEILASVSHQLAQRGDINKSLTRFVPVVEPSGAFLDVIDLFECVSRVHHVDSTVAVYGLGFVGLTIAVLLASRGYHVTGFDVSESLISQLSSGIPQVYEPNLDEMLIESLESGRLSLSSSSLLANSKYHVICVGTPVSDDGSVCLTALIQVIKDIAQHLKFGDVVMLRSTVPLGTCRNLVVPYLEEHSSLRCGRDFFLAFTPERTVEGQALQELTQLPQIVGGFSDSCAEAASAFWRKLTNIVILDSLEAAELVKLINNSFRDLSFAFANGVAQLADIYNLDASNIIASANEGYPRNYIPVPSPGVGGYCLSKDPLLYASSKSSSLFAELSLKGREINIRASNYPFIILQRYASRTEKLLSTMSILICGIAFKGLPETNDLRGAPALAVIELLHNSGCHIFCYDAIVSDEVLTSLGTTPVKTLQDGLSVDAILILNNHPSNILPGFRRYISSQNILVFDGWKLLDKLEIESIPGLTYACMGYMTPPAKI